MFYASRQALCLILVVHCLAPAVRCAGGSGVSWELDRLTLRGGKVVEGLIEKETSDHLRFLEICRPNHRSLYGVVRPIAREEIVSIERLDELQRAATRKKFNDYRNRGPIEAARMEDIELVSEPPKLKYSGEHFTLESTAPEEIVRRSAVRLEQMFEALRRRIPVRYSETRPVRILLFGSTSEYDDFVKRQSLAVKNPAVFHIPTNTIAVGGELKHTAEQLERVKREHDKQRAQLQQERADLDKRIEAINKELAQSGLTDMARRKLGLKKRNELVKELDKRLRALQGLDRRNDDVFKQMTDRMFAMLYHEAFHAYLENYVYPRHHHDVPRWLNEGLAQVFEAATVEGETFRVEAPHAEALEILRKELKSAKGGTGRLVDVLSADPASFLAMHGDQPAEPARHYAIAWGLAHYLTFELDLMGTLAMDRYVDPNEDLSPEGRFERLVNMPLDEFEPKWRRYIQSLKVPNSTGRKTD